MSFRVYCVIYAALLTLAASAPRCVVSYLDLVLYFSAFRALFPCLFCSLSHSSPLYHNIFILDTPHEAFALGEISKEEYLAMKAAAAKQRDNAAARISELEAMLENMGTDGSLQNGFVSAFGKYLEVEEITDEIATAVLREVCVFPGGRIETAWNYRDELKKLILDLQGDHQGGEKKSLDILQGSVP